MKPDQAPAGSPRTGQMKEELFIKLFQHFVRATPSHLHYVHVFMCLTFLVAAIYTGGALSTGHGSESVFRCSGVCTTCLLDICPFSASPSSAFLVAATCDQLTVVIWTSGLPSCQTGYIRRSCICLRRPVKLELTSCSPQRQQAFSLSFQTPP